MKATLSPLLTSPQNHCCFNHYISTSGISLILLTLHTVCAMRSVRASTRKKRKKQKRAAPSTSRTFTPQRQSSRCRDITPPSHSSTIASVDDLPLFSADDLIKINIVKDSLREYHTIPEGKEDASRMNAEQINMIKSSSLLRFHDLDYSF